MVLFTDNVKKIKGATHKNGDIVGTFNGSFTLHGTGNGTGNGEMGIQAISPHSLSLSRCSMYST